MDYNRCYIVFQTDMWNCLLLLSAKSKKVQYDHGGRIDLIGMDNAKLQCCTRALTNKCQELCANVSYRAVNQELCANVSYKEGC